MVAHLLHVDRATPLVLENLSMGRLGPWLDPATQLTLCCVLVLVLVVASVVARNKISADSINETAHSEQTVFSISSCILRYFTAATVLLFIYRSIPIVWALFWSTPPPPLTSPSSTMNRILDLIRTLVQHVYRLQAQAQPIRPPASPTRLASTSRVSTMLTLMQRYTTEQHLATLLNISMTMSMLRKFLLAATSRAVGHPPIGLKFHGLLFVAGVVILTITRHIGTHLSCAIVELIEQPVGGANAVLALDMVASLPALVLSQNYWLSIVTSLAALFGLGHLDTLVIYTTNIHGYKRFIFSTLSFVFPTLDQKPAFASVVILFTLLQSIKFTTSLVVHHGFALSFSPQRRKDESSLGTLLGDQFTQALLTDAMPGDAPTLIVQRSSWRSRVFEIFTNSKSSARKLAASEADLADMLAHTQELKMVQDQLQGKIDELQATKVSLVKKLRFARHKACLNESAMLRWKTLAERAAIMEVHVHEEVGMTAAQSTISQPTTMDSKDKGCDVAELVNPGDVEVLRCLLRDIKGDASRLKVWLEEDSAEPAEPQLTLPVDLAPIHQLRTLSQLCTSARAELIEVVTRVREQEKARRTQLSDALYQQKRSSWSLELASLDLKDNEDALREELYKKEDECEKLKATNKVLQEENEWWSNVDALRVDLFRLGRNFLGDRKRGRPTPTSRADPEPTKSRPPRPKNRLRACSSTPLVLSNRHESVALGAL